MAKHKLLSVAQCRRAEAEATREWLAALGPTPEDRVRAIEALFEENVATVRTTFFSDLSTYEQVDKPLVKIPLTRSLGGKGGKQGRIYRDRDYTITRKKTEKTDGYGYFQVSRSLAGMDHRERTYLRLAELLNSGAEGKEDAFRRWRAALIWGDGKGITGQCQSQNVDQSKDPVAEIIRRLDMSVDQTASAMQQYAESLRGSPDIAPELRELAEELGEQLAPAGGGSWLKPAQVAASPFASKSDYAVHIGSFSDGSPLTYSGEGSIVTIAPPGSGKTQCNVFPNLLTWPGPAIVLDISGDIYEHTAAWRAANVGPVYKFSPLEPEDSHKYNPLTFVRRDPDYLWEDSRLLAEMMIVPALSSDPFWENEARTVLTAAIAYVCYSEPPENRPLRSVLDILFGGEPWDRMILGLRMAVDVHVMTQHATALSSMNEKTLSSVLQTARSSLSAWSGERVARATSQSDWNPLELRDGSNPTIYVYIRPNEVDSYLSLLRVFIGQHIRVLTGGTPPQREAPPILVMLDELPRLRDMAPVDEALSIGRKYGLRLWMFAQSVGQFQTAYANADGMLGSCAVRIYMNPSNADGVAERVSEELGYLDSLQDNSRRRMVEATDLAGPTFSDQQIVLAAGSKPAKVSKDFAYRSPEFVSRMSATADLV